MSDAVRKDARAGAQPAAASRRVVLVTGLSGAGRSSALKVLEDMGYEAVDNLPVSLLPSLIRGETESAQTLSDKKETERPLAIGIDIRTRDFTAQHVLDKIAAVKAIDGIAIRILFLDCDDDVLLRRYTETRRRHPLATDRPVSDGIERERRLVAPLRDHADVVVDTSRLLLREFRQLMAGNFALDARTGFTIFLTSFSYREGLPREADLVFDARFLANPHYDAALRGLTGQDRRIRDYVAGDSGYASFVESLTAMLAPLLPRFELEGKSYLTIAVGCTGGRHRSVVVTEHLAEWLRERGHRVTVRHRDIGQAARD